MQHNAFLDYFEPLQKLFGVAVIADDSVGTIRYPLTIWPPKWSQADLESPNHLKHTGAEIAAVNSLVASDSDPAEPTIVINQWVEPSPPREAVKTFLNELRPVERIRKMAERFWDEKIGSAPTVAIHLRHGNGENIGYRSAYWLGPLALVRQLSANAKVDVHRPGISGRFLDNMPPSLVGSPGQASAERRFCNHVAAEFRRLVKKNNMKHAVPFLFCDSSEVIGLMREVLPNLVTWPKQLLKQGEGPLHQLRVPAGEQSAAAGGYGGTISDEITRDMFVELELMKRCDGLVYMDSGFSLIARLKLDDNRLHRLKPNFVNETIAKLFSRFS
jgi:hypothetical protein